MGAQEERDHRHKTGAMTSGISRIALGLGVAALALTGCGNWVGDVEHVGRVGLTVDDTGGPVVLVAPCRTGTVQVSIVLGRTPDMAGDEENEKVGTWTARTASDRLSELNLADPGSDWDGDPAGPPRKEQTWIVNGTFTEDADTEVVMVGPFVEASQLDELTPDHVLVADGEQSRSIDHTAFDGDC